MRTEELYHRGQGAGLAQRRTQFLGAEPGEREEALGPVLVDQDPAQRIERQRLRVGGGWRVSKNCQPRSRGIDGMAGTSGALSLRWSSGRRMAKRILVVEDNDLNRKLFCDVLRAQGFAIEPVADGLDALDRARQFVPNLVIMDIQLPNVSGLDLIEAAKKDSVLRPIPILAVTAYAGKGDEERIREAGAEGYLAKPVSIGPFMQAVRALL